MVMDKPGAWRRIVLVVLACLPLLAAAQDEESRQAFIELSASDDELYVQQQLLLTVKLYYTNNVIQGNLDDPEHPDAVIEKLGEQKQYQEKLDGERYRVVERRYLVFPQKPGRLQLPPVEFLGTARHSRGHHYRVTDSAALFALNVRDIPDSFSGRTWLPASHVELSADGLEDEGPVTPGEDLTRTLTLSARGLPATTLPELDHDYPDALRSYPEPEQRESTATEDGVEGRLQQTVALVPVPGEGGEVVIPEVRIPWWDVNEDRQRVAVLPERTLQLAGTVATDNDGNGADMAATTEADRPQEPAPGNTTGHWIWPLLTALMLLGWLSTATAWWLHTRRKRNIPVVDTHDAPDERRQFAQVCEQARTLAPAFFNDFPAWVRQLTGGRCSTSEQAMALLGNPRLTRAVSQWQAHLFGNHQAPAPDGRELVTTLKATRRQWRAHQHGSDTTRGSLPALYPPGLRP